MACAQEAEAGTLNGLMHMDNEKLQNVYFSYQSLENELGLAGDGPAGLMPGGQAVPSDPAAAASPR
eukprot:773196-Pelagomonas_calceolata.AAC.1